MSQTLGRTIRELRLEAGITLRSFASSIGVSAAHQSDIEHGRRMPSDNLLKKIAAKLQGVGASYDSLKELDPRLESDLAEWVQETPEARQLLREAKESGRPVKEILRDLRDTLREKES